MKSEKTGGVNGQLQLPGTELSHAIGTPGEDPNKLASSHQMISDKNLKANI